MNLYAKLNPLGHVVVLVLALGVLAFTSASPTDSFDAPVKKEVVDFGPSPYYLAGSRVRAKLSFYFFSTLVVKEYDEGQKGAEWLAIVPTEKGIIPYQTPQEVYEGQTSGGIRTLCAV